MNLEQLKVKTGEFLEYAQSLLNRHGYLDPIMFSIIDDSSIPVALKLDTAEDMENAQEVIKQTAEISDSVVLLIDFCLVETKSETLPEETKNLPDLEDLPEDLKTHPDAVNAIVCIIHTKTESLIKQLFYVKANEKFSFFENTWEPAIFHDGHFKNPYQK